MLREKIITAINEVGFDEYKEICQPILFLPTLFLPAAKQTPVEISDKTIPAHRFQATWRPINNGS